MAYFVLGFMCGVAFGIFLMSLMSISKKWSEEEENEDKDK